jgi:hypothetical protein
VADSEKVHDLGGRCVDAADEFGERCPPMKVLSRLPALSAFERRERPAQLFDGLQHAGVHPCTYVVRQLNTPNERGEQS